MSELDPTQIRAILDVIERALTPGADAATKAKGARACAGLASVLEAEAGAAADATNAPGATSGAAPGAAPAKPPQHWIDRVIWLATAPEAAEVRQGLLASLREATASPANAEAVVLDIPFIGNRRLLN